MKKLLFLALLLPLLLRSQPVPIQRQALTTNTLPAGVNGQVLLLVSGVPRWGTNGIGDLTISNLTVLGTLTVSTNIVLNGTGPGIVQLFTTNGIQRITISSPNVIGNDYTLYLPVDIQTNAVLQTTAAGQLYWTTDPTLNSVEVNGSGAGFLLVGDASTTNTLKMIGPAAFGSSFTNLWPENNGTNGQVITMGTNGQWYFSTPSGGGGSSGPWTNDATFLFPSGTTMSNTAQVYIRRGDGSFFLGANTWKDIDITATNTFSPLHALNFMDAGEPKFSLVAWGGTDSDSYNYYSEVFSAVNTDKDTPSAEIDLWAFATNANRSITIKAAPGSSEISLDKDGAKVWRVNDDGNLDRVKGVTYSWPSANAVGTLRNDGAGALTWSTVEPIASLTWASTTTLDVHATNANYRSLTLGGDTTFDTANRAAGHWITVFVTGAATNCALTLPSWKVMNQASPTNLAAGKVASLTVFFTGTTDASGICNYAVQP